MVQSFNLDFVINVLKKTNNPNRDKYLEVFKSKGLSTGFHEFHDFWEDFAEFILSRDFKIYKISYPKVSEDFDKWNDRLPHLLDKRLQHRQSVVLCDILKRKFEFELRPHGYDSRPVSIEKNGIKYFKIPFKGWIFIVPKDEVDKTLKKIREMRDAGNLRSKTFCSVPKNPPISTQHLFTFMRTPTEIKEFREEMKKSPESAELKIQLDKITYESYKSIFTKNNIMLSEDELQHLKELITIQSPTIDFLGITKPSSSFSRPFYFIEVKSSKFGYPRLTHSQRKFIENGEEKFGMFVFHIEIEPNGVKVKFFSP
jgi:hypothetical protein